MVGGTVRNQSPLLFAVLRRVRSLASAIVRSIQSPEIQIVPRRFFEVADAAQLDEMTKLCRGPERGGEIEHSPGDDIKPSLCCPRIDTAGSYGYRVVC